jgi:hypothetical protein
MKVVNLNEMCILGHAGPKFSLRGPVVKVGFYVLRKYVYSSMCMEYDYPVICMPGDGRYTHLDRRTHWAEFSFCPQIRGPAGKIYSFILKPRRGSGILTGPL